MTLGSPARRPTVLIVLHQEHSTPGRVGAALKAMDVRLDIRRPSCGEPLPETLAESLADQAAYGVECSSRRKTNDYMHWTVWVTCCEAWPG